jgi:hypothetical protein
MAAAKVYIEQLYPRGHGWPLWEPECEVHVGDVGFFESDTGNFCRLFNVLADQDDPVNRDHRGTPEGFVPLRLRDCDWTIRSDYFVPGQPVMAHTVAASQLDFQATA